MSERPHDEAWRELAEAMVSRQLGSRGIDDPRVLDAMRRVPRHVFVPDVSCPAAYSDHALAIDASQTISQPYIVARMTQLLRVEPGARVLEIGTGSGYQAAVLLELGADLVTVERHAVLAETAAQRLGEWFDPARFEVVVNDGTRGYPDAGPYDRIVVTAAAPSPPQPLQDQLADGGRMVVPLGERLGQVLTVLERRGEAWTRHEDIPCRFVPLLGEHGFEA